MSSLQPDLVYKHTITFTAELAGLPWVRLEKPEGSQLPLLHGTSPTFRALLLQTHLPALCLYLFVLGRHQLTCRCGPLKMPFWRCSGNIFLTRFLWILGAIPLHCWVQSSSRSQSPCWCFTTAWAHTETNRLIFLLANPPRWQSEWGFEVIGVIDCSSWLSFKEITFQLKHKVLTNAIKFLWMLLFSEPQWRKQNSKYRVINSLQLMT